MTNCSVTWNEKAIEPKWRSAFVFGDISNLQLNNIAGKPAPLSDAPAIVLNNVNTGFLGYCCNTADSGILKITGKETRNIQVVGCSPARIDISPDIRKHVTNYK
jgi:hypothetical protein